MDGDGKRREDGVRKREQWRREGKIRSFPYSREAGQSKMDNFRIGTRKRTFNFDKARHPRRTYTWCGHVNSKPLRCGVVLWINIGMKLNHAFVRGAEG
jgi:hypothetical protein